VHDTAIIMQVAAFMVAGLIVGRWLTGILVAMTLIVTWVLALSEEKGWHLLCLNPVSADDCLRGFLCNDAYRKAC
jgi:hypothetical protein